MAEKVSLGRFAEVITKCTEAIRAARTALERIMLTPDLPGQLTALEKEAYPTFWAIFKDLPKSLREQETAANSAGASPA